MYSYDDLYEHTLKLYVSTVDVEPVCSISKHPNPVPAPNLSTGFVLPVKIQRILGLYNMKYKCTCFTYVCQYAVQTILCSTKLFLSYHFSWLVPF